MVRRFDVNDAFSYTRIGYVIYLAYLQFDIQLK